MEYYSPSKVLGVLNRCGVDEFIVSSTCAQVACISVAELNREAREMKRLAGRRAHLFLWVSAHVLDEDPNLEALNELCLVDGREMRLYEGIKLHEMETPWYRERRRDLMRIVAMADERGLAVQFHTGAMDGCEPSQLAKIAERFPNVRFDFAHCRDMLEMAKVMADAPNVWSDTAYLPIEAFRELKEFDWHGRLMFGTDLPVWQAHEDVQLTSRYRDYVNAARGVFSSGFGAAFEAFVGE